MISALREPRDLNISMQKLVYYLVHQDTELRLGYYKTLAGARIAQRARNSHLGFRHRIQRVNQDNWEVEQCMVQDQIVAATYVIVEDHIETQDLLLS